MNATMAWRYFWREYRMARSFWIAIFALTVGLQLMWLAAIAIWPQSIGHDSDSTTPLWGIAVVMPLIYVLGWAATAFSREHESGSFTLLTELPTHPAPIWLGKLGFTLLSSLALGLFLAVATWLLGTIPWVNATTLAYWGLWLVSIAGVGSVCSQWIKRPLTATFATGALILVVALFPTNRSASLRDQIHWLNQGVIFALGLVAFACSYPATRLWLADRLSFSGALAAPRARPGFGGVDVAAGWKSQFWRHAWVGWRRLGMIWLATGVLAVVAAATVAATFVTRRPPTTLQALSGLSVLILVAWPLVLGTTLFHCEQAAEHARLLVAQGVSPARFWGLRQLAGWSCVVALCLAIAAIGGTQEQFRHAMKVMHHGYWAYVILAFASSQWISMTVRSSLTAHAVAALAGGVVMGWTALHSWLAIPWWIAVAIPGTGLLLASRLRASAWLLEWNQLLHWRGAALALLATLVLLLVAFTTYRVTEIPRVELTFNVAEFTAAVDAQYNASAADTLRKAGAALLGAVAARPMRYEQTSVDLVRDGEAQAVAWASLPLPIPEAESRWLAEAGEILTRAVDQAVRQAHGLDDSSRWQPQYLGYSGLLETGRLGNLWVARARQHQQAGRLDEAAEDYQRSLMLCLQLRRQGIPLAWLIASRLEQMTLDNLVFWAAAPGQDAERVTKTSQWLVDHWHEQPPWDTPMKVEYIIHSRLVEGLPDSLDQLGGLGPDATWMVYAVRLLPGEKARLRRFLLAEFAPWISVFQSASGSDLLTLWRGQSVAMGRSSIQAQAENPPQVEWRRTTPLSPLLLTSGSKLLDLQLDLPQCRGATLLRMLLVEHRLLTGEYPAVADDGQLPEPITDRATMLLAPTNGARGEVLEPGEFSYERLPEEPDMRYLEFNEPLGTFITDAGGQLAIITRTGPRAVYPLPGP
jgi:hypothetical protein